MIYEDEDEGLTHQERMLKELYERRTEEELNSLLVSSLRKLHNLED
jgi:hypothetical protein